MNPLVQCPRCRAWLMEGVFNQPTFAPCPACGSGLQVEVFPALFRKTSAGQGGETIMMEGESSCFYHPQKKAARPCDGCGRFLCALCDCELDGRHLCPTCLETGKTKGKIESLDNERTLYDSIALALAILPMLIFYFTLVTAPMALFVAIRYWKAPRSILHRTRIRAVAAIVISLLQIGGWATLFIVLATRR
ncbi:MAG: hypothetical protein KGR98_10580 [Verrucomicrobia bacterium]|nr:hypothetical protein [Verrucomicrobiota bacterium]MDE3099201.1 hypothetical protein [Verrucomicrobiota bacterium]